MSNLSKVLPVEERTFSKVYQMMRARRAAMPQDPISMFRKRRTSGVSWIEPVPPVTSEPEIAKPLSVVSISSDDLDEDESPAALLPEVGFVSALVAGEDDLEIEPEETESSDSDGEEQDGGYAEVHEE